jgi:hypothetical protein
MSPEAEVKALITGIDKKFITKPIRKSPKITCREAKERE